MPPSRVCRRVGVERRRRGVSLLELLTIMAIITLLASLVLPGLSRTRASGMQSVCLSRLQGIATASHVYRADDPSGWGIPVHPGQYNQNPSNATYVGAYEWGGKSGIGRTDGGAPGGPPVLGSKYGTLAGFGPATRPMNEVLYNTGFMDYKHPFDRWGADRDTKLPLDLFECPSDDGPPRGGHCPDWIAHSERSSYDHFGNSYAANLLMIGSSGSGYLGSNSPYMRPLTRVPAPSRTLFYEENIGRWAWAAREDPCDSVTGIDVGPTKVIRGWHGRDWTFNRAFGDSHAETQRVYRNGTEDAEGYAGHYVSEQLSSYPRWDADNDGIPETPGNYGAYRCIIIRGPGWAKDTLPAPFVPTGLRGIGSGRPAYEDCVEE